MSDSLQSFGAHQAPLFMGFFRQEYWSELPYPPPGDLPNPRYVSCGSCIAGRVFTTEPSRKPQCRAYLERNWILTKSSPSPVCFLLSCILYEGRKQREDEIKQDEKKLIFYMLSISVLSSMIVHLSDLITLYMRTVVLEKTLKGPLDCKEIKPVHPKRNLS